MDAVPFGQPPHWSRARAYVGGADQGADQARWERAFGWPLLALRTEQRCEYDPGPARLDPRAMWSESQTRSGIRIGYTTEWLHALPSDLRLRLPWHPDFLATGLVDLPTALPLAPIWPGFLVNALFYALTGAGLFWAVRRVNHGVARPFRRGRQLQRGRCPSCRYPFGDLPRCPECGDDLTWRGGRTPAVRPA
ncbi:MAG: hypothetical protein ACIARR_13020 [Phycisphaerales bacterium JB059]